MAAPSSVLAVAALLLVAVAAPAAAFSTESTWTAARSTFYGTDAWSIHTGSCGFGFICPNRWSDELQKGSDVTAVPDGSDLYGHCGECLQVRCRSAVISDGEGGELDRTGLCLNDKSVKVKIVDTCPCNYAANAASNKRWCCGDFPHLDMSKFALEKIVDDAQRWGVFGIEYRKIDCSLDIGSEAAPEIANPSKDPHASSKPSTLNCATQSTGTDGSTGSGNTGSASSARIARSSTSSSSTSSNALTTEASSTQRATTAKSSGKTYWQNFWHTTFRGYTQDQKKRFYKKLWARIRAGELTRQGHSKGRRLLQN